MIFDDCTIDLLLLLLVCKFFFQSVKSKLFSLPFVFEILEYVRVTYGEANVAGRVRRKTLFLFSMYSTIIMVSSIPPRASSLGDTGTERNIVDISSMSAYGVSSAPVHGSCIGQTPKSMLGPLLAPGGYIAPSARLICRGMERRMRYGTG
jgi:hypothetical protein